MCRARQLQSGCVHLRIGLVDQALLESAADTYSGCGTWICDITTGGNDPLATQIAAFLIPNGYGPPSLGGQQTLPGELFANAVDYVIVDRPPPMP